MTVLMKTVACSVERPGRRFGLGSERVLGVFQLNVSVKRFIEHFSGFLVGILWIGYCLFDADDLMALRALANAMTGAIHLILWSKPTHADQFWFFHADSFLQTR